MKRSAILVGALALALGGAFVSMPSFGDEKPLYITVVKSTGFNWFKRMEVGVKEFGQKNNINAVQVGPSKADSAMQLQSLEDAISQDHALLQLTPAVLRVRAVLRSPLAQRRGLELYGLDILRQSDVGHRTQ